MPKSELQEESGGWCDYMLELESSISSPEATREDDWFLTKVTMTGQQRTPEAEPYKLLHCRQAASNQLHSYW